MERVPEAELMNDLAQAEAYANADFSEPHAAFVDRFRACFPRHAPREVLDLGCGTADVTLRFARAFPNCRLTGIDAAPAMLAFARKAVERAGLAARVHLVEGRLSLASGAAGLDRRYDTVISNSLLHHLAEPLALWRAVRELATTRAAVFVMDLRRPDSRAEAQALVERHAGGEAQLFKQDFFCSLLAAYRKEEVEAQLAQAGLEALRVETPGDRHLVVRGYLP